MLTKDAVEKKKFEMDIQFTIKSVVATTQESSNTNEVIWCQP
jgi:hypothetical protein